MPYRVYKYAGRWHFKDSRGVRHSYDTERGARIWAGRIYAFYEKSIKKLHYDTGDDFGKTVYEEMYADDDQASAALAKSGGKCVLRWMMNWDDNSTGHRNEFDAINQLNDGTDLFVKNGGDGDGYSVNDVIEAMGMKLVKLFGQWRLFRDADSPNDANYNTIFRITT